MSFKTGFVFYAFVLGSIAVPVPDLNPETDLSIFFETPQPGSRIVGGTPAAPASHPWLVALTSGSSVRTFFCGGSFISTETVLTAAHCITPFVSEGVLSSALRVVIGTNEWNSGGEVLTLNGHNVHPLYNPRLIKNDVGVLHTSSAIVVSDTVRPIAVSYKHIGHGVDTRVAGWGRTSANEPGSPVLLEIEVPTLSGEDCVRDIRTAAQNLNAPVPRVDPRIEICTFAFLGRGTCRGDSGSALVSISSGQLVGIVSWGFPCALGAPDMYVRVSAYKLWIQRNTRE